MTWQQWRSDLRDEYLTTLRPDDELVDWLYAHDAWPGWTREHSYVYRAYHHNDAWQRLVRLRHFIHAFAVNALAGRPPSHYAKAMNACRRAR